MIFSSYRFLFGFLPVVLLGYHALRRAGRVRAMKLFLVVASLVFYGIGQPNFILGFAACAAGNYLLCVALTRVHKPLGRALLAACAVVLNLGLLFVYKYLGFFAEIVNLIAGTAWKPPLLLLPLGISFFTFQILAYTLEVYHGRAPLAGALDYGVFVTFFPQLIVGPVVKQDEVLPQLSPERLGAFDTVNVARGLMLFAIGCAKKLLLADPLIGYATSYYAGNVETAGLCAAWCGVLCYTFAYYFDFSGYIDMARGLGHWFGIDLPINFNSPYRARNFAEFWRRWNITISRFFSDTVFARLFHFGDGIGRLLFATLATFLVSGLWHGAGWHYLAWGLVNGILVSAANLMTLYRKSLPKSLAVVLTFVCSILVRVLFDCTDLVQAGQVYRAMFAIGTALPSLHTVASFVWDNVYVLLVLAVSAVVCFCFSNSNDISARTHFRARDAVWSAVLLMLSIFSMSQVSGFLYFNF